MAESIRPNVSIRPPASRDVGGGGVGPTCALAPSAVAEELTAPASSRDAGGLIETFGRIDSAIDLPPWVKSAVILSLPAKPAMPTSFRLASSSPRGDVRLMFSASIAESLSDGDTARL